MDNQDIFNNCPACGGQWLSSGDFKYRLIPSKPLRHKSLKMYHKLKRNEIVPATPTNSKNISKFDKYIPRNSIEVTCRKCKTIVRQSVFKPIPKLPTAPKIKTPKKKMSKDLNAGLILPPKQSLNPISNSFTPTSTSKIFDSSSQMHGKRKAEAWSDRSREFNQKQRKIEAISKSKERNELRKSLLKSKHFSNSSTKSLDNFLN